MAETRALTLIVQFSAARGSPVRHANVAGHFWHRTLCQLRADQMLRASALIIEAVTALPYIHRSRHRDAVH